MSQRKSKNRKYKNTKATKSSASPAIKDSDSGDQLPLIPKLLIMGIVSFSFFLFWPYEPHPSWSAELTAVVLSCLLFLYSFFKYHKDQPMELGPFEFALALSIPLILGIDALNGFHNPLTSIATLAFTSSAVLLALSIRLLTKMGYSVLPAVAWGLLFGGIVQYLFCFLQVGGYLQDYQHFTSNKPLWFPHFNPRPEANGIVFQKNHLAAYTVIVTMGVGYLVCKKFLKEKFFWIHLPFAALTLGLTASRTAFVYVLGLAALSFFKYEKTDMTDKYRKYLRIFAAVTFCCLLFQPYIMKGVSYLSPQALTNTAVDRIVEDKTPTGLRPWLWRSAISQFIEKPLIGEGSGSYSTARLDYNASKDFDEDTLDGAFYFHAHNSLLQLMSEYGISVSLILLIAVLALFFFMVRKPLGLEHAFILVAFGVNMLHGQVEHPLWFMYFLALITIFMAAAAVPTVQIPAPKISKWIAMAMAVTLLGFSVKYTADYIYLPWVKYRKVKKPLSDAEKNKLKAMGTHPLLGTSASIMILGHTMDMSDRNLSEKLAVTSRLVLQRPTPFTMFRHSLYLTYNGQIEEAKATAKEAFYSYTTAPQFMFNWLNRVAKDPRVFPLRDYMIELFEIRRAEQRRRKKIEEANKKKDS